MADNLAENELNPLQETSEIINNQEEIVNQEEVVQESDSQASDSQEINTDVQVAENPPAPEVDENTSNTETTPVADVPVESTTETTPVEEVPVVANTEATPVAEVPAKAAEAPAREHKPRENNNPKFDALFERLKIVKDKNETINVSVKERIKGGLRCFFEDMPLFLPASHFALKRNPTEQAMHEAIGKTLTVHIHELQEDETKRKTVIVSRKQILEEKFWNSLTVGDVIEGPVTSIASFGIFIDVYGVEGLVHVSRLSNSRIEDVKLAYKKGQLLKAVIVEVNKDRKRIGLSTKELEESPWKGITSDFQNGAVIKGIVRRVTDFGAYVEIKPGVDGLCRASEMSWTLRIKNPSDVFTPNQEMDFVVISSNEDKKTIALSLKRLTENPWKDLFDKYPAKTKVNGTIKYLMAQGAVVNINDEVDGFMPRSKMRFLPKGLNNPGDVVELLIDNIDLEKESLIVVPVGEEKPQQFKPKDKPKSDSGPRYKDQDHNSSSSSSSSDSASFTLQDLLSDAMKKNLLNN
jgi:ribosomal protein S1